MFRKLVFSLFVLFIATSIQAQIVPYYGKNNVKYDTFDWKTYKTTHFEIFFYPQSEAHLQRVASMAESAYDKISADLQHDIEFKIPLIFFKTQSEFEQANYIQVSEGILGVAEPFYNRMAFAIDQPSDKLQELVLHELTHVFEFSMLFGGMISPVVRWSPPLWVMEGFAEFETGVWDPSDLMIVRDAVLTERLPFLSLLEDLVAPGGADLGRAPYNVGHAAFEFMREKYGDAAIRQFWFYLKKATLLGAEDVIYSALGVKEETFNEQYAGYLRERFKEFQDKQSPIDYGKEVNLQGKYQQIFSQTPSPDGKEFIVLTASREDYEFDVVKIDVEGKILEKLTGGFTTKFDYITTDSWTFEGRNLSWSEDGSRVAFFARAGKRRALFVFDPRDGHQIKKIKFQLDQAASPSLSPDGKTVLITGLENGKPDMFLVDIETESIRNLTNDVLYEKTPMWSPDGKYIYYTTRIRSRDQIMRMDAADPKQIEELTDSDYNSLSPFYDQATNSIFYCADKNTAHNLYKLDLATGDKTQYTDVIGGNFSPVVFRKDGVTKVAFTSFFKGQYRFFVMDLPKAVAVIPKGSEGHEEGGLGTTGEQLAKTFGTQPVAGQTVSGSFQEAGAAAVDFHPTKELVIDEKKIQDKKFRAVLSSRPDVVTGVSGDTFAVAGGVVIGDILGDQEFRIFTSRIRGFQSYYFGYLDLRRRLQYLTDFTFNDDFFLSPLPLELSQQFGEDADIVRSRTYGGRFVSQFPLNRYYRLEMSAGVFDLSQEFIEPAIQEAFENFLARTGQDDPLADGGYVPVGATFVGETTRFREFGPLSGYTFRISYNYAIPVADNWIERTVFSADVRKYFRLTSRSVFALRGRGFHSGGKDPVIFSFGGGLDIRGFDFREIVGTRGGIANIEMRMPLYPNPRVPFLGQMRGRFFIDYFRMGFETDLFNATIVRDVGPDLFLMRTEDGMGSVGFGFTVFAGGLPFNFDFSKVYGEGVLIPPGFIGPRPTQTEFHFTDGIEFDFSIGYEF